MGRVRYRMCGSRSATCRRSEALIDCDRHGFAAGEGGRAQRVRITAGAGTLGGGGLDDGFHQTVVDVARRGDGDGVLAGRLMQSARRFDEFLAQGGNDAGIEGRLTAQFAHGARIGVHQLALLGLQRGDAEDASLLQQFGLAAHHVDHAAGDYDQLADDAFAAHVLLPSWSSRICRMTWSATPTPPDLARARPYSSCSIEPKRSPAWPPPNSERSEEHTSELQSLMRISYAVFCLKK